MPASGSGPILPMAITKADDEFACVGALTESGKWVRPEPVPLDQVRDRAASVWRYHRWTTVTLSAPVVADPRPEDRELLGAPVPAGEWDVARFRAWADQFVDPDVERAFTDERSLGLIHARLRHVYTRRATRGRVFVRFVFTDSTGEEFDWIVPDVEIASPLLERTRDGELPVGLGDRVRDSLQEGGPLLLVLGLTRPTNRFPSRFRGCYPLVVGVHPMAPAGQVWQ